jgi:hypothetical protein
LDERAAEGHHDMVAQPHSEEEGAVAEAEIAAAEMSSDEQPLGSLGRPIALKSQRRGLCDASLGSRGAAAARRGL